MLTKLTQGEIFLGSYISGGFVKEIRIRKRWQQIRMMPQSKQADRTLTRVENYYHNPSDEVLYSLIDSMEVPSDELMYPYLEDQTLAAYTVYDQIALVLDNDKSEIAEELIKELEDMSGFDEGINLQALISYKVQLAYMQQKDFINIIKESKKGIKITFPEFDENNFGIYPLIFEEVELLHTMARAYGRLGNIQHAIKILTSIKNSLMVLPEDKRHKEKRLVKVLKTLAEFLVKAEDFQESLEMCELGINISLKWNRGKEIPDFLCIKAYCLFKLDTPKHCYDLLAQAYFGYLLLRKQKQAKLVLKNSYEIFGISIETYGSEKLSLNLDPTHFKFERGEIVKCTSLGNLIGILRTKADLSQQELCQGLCSSPTMSKIESDKVRTNVYNLEVFMQRLGRDANMYINTFLSKKDFDLKQIRDEIMALLPEGHDEGIEVLLEQVKHEKDFKRGSNLQFVKMVESDILFYKEKKYTETYVNMVYDALRITLPKFKESMIEHYHLSFYEISLINKLALYFCETGQRVKGIRIFERLKESMNKTYVDEVEKMNLYGVVLYNYSKMLGLEGRYKEGMEIIEEGGMMCVKHGKLASLPSYAVNKACNLLNLGKKEESLPYFAMAYYGSGAVGRIKNEAITKNYVKDKLGIDFK